MRAFGLLLLLAGCFLLLASYHYRVQNVSVLGWLAVLCCIKLFRRPGDKGATK